MITLKLASSFDEIEFLFKARTDPMIVKMLSGKPPKDMATHISYINKNQGQSRFIYIAYNDKMEKIGYSQVYNITPGTVEVGFVIIPEYQGFKYGQSLVQETINIAKTHFPQKNIVLCVKNSNHRGIHIYKKYGFVIIGVDEDLTYMSLSN